MKIMRRQSSCALAFLLILALIPVTVLAQVGPHMYSCESKSRIRIVKVDFPDWPENKTRCKVTYDKSGEGLGEKVLWQAENTKDYCAVKAKQFAQKLETLGWDCGIGIDSDSDTSESETEQKRTAKAQAPAPQPLAKPSRSVAGQISKAAKAAKVVETEKKAPAPIVAAEMSKPPKVAAPARPQAPAVVTSTSVATRTESCQETPASIAWRESDPKFPGGEWECERFGKTRIVVSNYDARNGLRVIYQGRPFDLETDERINTLADSLEWREVSSTSGKGFTSLIYQVEHQIDTRGATANKFVVARFGDNSVCTIGIINQSGSVRSAQTSARELADDPNAQCSSAKPTR